MDIKKIKIGKESEVFIADQLNVDHRSGGKYRELSKELESLCACVAKENSLHNKEILSSLNYIIEKIESDVPPTDALSTIKKIKSLNSSVWEKLCSIAGKFSKNWLFSLIESSLDNSP